MNVNRYSENIENEVWEGLLKLAKCPISKKDLTGSVVSFFPCQHKANADESIKRFGPLGFILGSKQTKCPVPSCPKEIFAHTKDPTMTEIAQILYTNPEKIPSLQARIALAILDLKALLKAQVITLHAVSFFPCNHKFNQNALKTQKEPHCTNRECKEKPSRNYYQDPVIQQIANLLKVPERSSIARELAKEQKESRV